MVKTLKFLKSAAFVLGPGWALAFAPITACKAKPSSQGSSKQVSWNNNGNGISLVAGTSVTGDAKSLIYATVRDAAAVVAFCPDTVSACSTRQIPAVPGRLVKSTGTAVTWASVVEFDLKEITKFSAFVRMVGGGLVCAEFTSEATLLGPVIVVVPVSGTTSQSPSLCAGSDPAALGNGALRQMLVENIATPPVPSGSDWVPNPEGSLLSDAERELVRRTNEIRATAGLPPLLVSSQLMMLARSWAQSVAFRMSANEHSTYGVAENTCCSPPGPFTALQAVGIWQYSPDANEKMLARAARYIGVGSAMDAYGNFYWYQQFL